jgi:class 3 adenylate cyclase
VRICASCGEENSDRARFCQACAAPLEDLAVVATERKLVTILFADLTGSTGLGERLDPERLSEVMRAYFDAMRAEIEAEGGTVEKFIGDAIVAAFGVPAAHDDDPARALRAALRMRSRLGELNRTLSERYGLALAMRMGVNTGEAITRTAPVAGEPMATGDVVNVAARLEQTCEPGGILVAERTARAVRGFRFEDASSLVLRGRDVPMNARLLAGADEDRAGRGLPAMRVRMVGRDHELGILTSQFSRVDVERRPHLVTVYGDAGVGKSRLISEFAAWAQALDHPAGVVHGRCLSYGEGVGYWPLAEILKERAAVLDTDASDVALRRVRELGAALLTPDIAADPARSIAALGHTVGLDDPDVDFGGLPARQVRLEIHAAWRSFFSALARTNPLLVIVDDIHWADAAMLDLLEELGTRVRGPVMFICSSRPELTARRPGWGGGRRDVSSVLLEPLSGADADLLVHQLLEVDDIPNAVKRRILDRAEGNPFFLEEIIRRLLDEGMIIRSEDGWQAASAIAEVTIPDTVQGVLAARVDLLDPLHKRALQMAATVGRVFWTDPVRRLVGEGADLDALLERLEERELVVEQLGSAMAGQREYTFKHGLTRDVAYESLPHRDRARAHQLVADWLEETTGERRAEFYELLAFHYEQAHRYALESDHATAEPPRRRALDYLLLAARQANARLAINAAQRLAERALELAAGGRERALALTVLGQVATNDFRGDDVWRCYTEAADAMLAAAPGEHDTIALLCGRALEVPVRNGGLLAHTVVADSDIRRYMEMGFANAGEGDSEALARLLTCRCSLPFRYAAIASPEAVRSIVDGERAAAIAERLNRPDLLSAALDSINVHQLERGLFGEMERTVARRAALLPQMNDPWEIADAYNMMGWAATVLGKYREVLDIAATATKTSTAATEARIVAQLVIPWSTIARMRLGDFAGCLEDFAEGMRMLGDRAANPVPFFTRHYGCAAFVHELRGDSDAADRILGPLQLALVPNTPEVVLSWARSWQALILAHRDRAEEARAVLEQVRGWRQWRAFALEALCDIVAAQQQWDDALGVWTEARTAAAEGESRSMPCYADRLEGRAATAGGDHATAVALLTRAAHGFEEIEARWELACTRLSLAEALRRHGERDTARAELLRAEPVFAELRSLRELDEARAALASL